MKFPNRPAEGGWFLMHHVNVAWIMRPQAKKQSIAVCNEGIDLSKSTLSWSLGLMLASAPQRQRGKSHFGDTECGDGIRPQAQFLDMGAARQRLCLHR